MSDIARIARRAAALLILLVALGAPLAHAQEATTTDGTTTDATITDGTTTDSGTTGGTTTAESPPPPPLIAAGVTIGGVAVGGLTGDEAAAAVRASFARRFVFTFRGHTRRAAPLQVGARANVTLGVANALAAAPFAALRLPVTVGAHRLRAYATSISRAFSRPAVSSTAQLVGLRPRLTRSHRGFRVRQLVLRHRIRRAALANTRGPLGVPYRILLPRFNRQNFGAVIVIRRASHLLYLYNGARFWRRFGVAVGQPIYPTPLGRFYIAVKQRNPWWYPPNSTWAAGASPIAPGPGNPLGTRWMGLSWGGIGIHGTPDAASIGYSASHGCIRMRIPEAEWLFDRVRIGTPVFIIPA
jgi:lipoprotein-anchoring transpeptidase ErfK/SrfK